MPYKLKKSSKAALQLCTGCASLQLLQWRHFYFAGRAAAWRIGCLSSTAAYKSQCVPFILSLSETK